MELEIFNENYGQNIECPQTHTQALPNDTRIISSTLKSRSRVRIDVHVVVMKRKKW